MPKRRFSHTFWRGRHAHCQLHLLEVQWVTQVVVGWMWEAVGQTKYYAHRMWAQQFSHCKWEACFCCMCLRPLLKLQLSGDDVNIWGLQLSGQYSTHMFGKQAVMIGKLLSAGSVKQRTLALPLCVARTAFIVSACFWKYTFSKQMPLKNLEDCKIGWAWVTGHSVSSSLLKWWEQALAFLV